MAERCAHCGSFLVEPTDPQADAECPSCETLFVDVATDGENSPRYRDARLSDSVESGDYRTPEYILAHLREQFGDDVVDDAAGSGTFLESARHPDRTRGGDGQ